MKSKIIAISAISASFISIFLTIGVWVPVLDLASVVFASVFVVLPIAYDYSYKGSFFAFIVGGILAFLFGAFNFLNLVFPAYLGFFGIFPILKLLSIEKKWNPIVFYLIGLIWLLAVSYGLYYFYTLVMKMELTNFPENVKQFILLFIALFGALIFVLYDRMVILIKNVFKRIINKRPDKND